MAHGIDAVFARFWCGGKTVYFLPAVALAAGTHRQWIRARLLNETLT